MENIRNFSIEPYIDGGGILGRELQVNEEVSLKVMKGTGIQKDVVLTRDDTNDKYQYNGSDEIEISTASAQRGLTVTTDDNFELRQKGTNWEIAVFDQEVHGDIDNWMQQKYKKGMTAGSQIYKEQFIKELNKITRKNLSVISGKEKNERLRKSATISALNDLQLGVGLGMTVGGGFLLKETIVPAMTDNDGLDGFLKISTLILSASLLRLGIGFSILGVADMEDGRKHNLRAWEVFLPNPQLRARAKSELTLMRERGNILELKPKEDN